jgi:hypothetical protein
VTFEDVATLAVPAGVVAQTEEGLQHAGQEGYEVFVLWSGFQQGTTGHVRTAHLPRQSSYKTESGLFVRVEGEALHRLNAWLFENTELLLAQVHAHPTDAFHSETDDAFPIVTTLGGFSIVAANFARDGLFGEGTAAYRLQESGWVEVPTELITVLQ